MIACSEAGLSERLYSNRAGVRVKLVCGEPHGAVKKWRFRDFPKDIVSELGVETRCIRSYERGENAFP
jgi:hypothetical protein